MTHDSLCPIAQPCVDVPRHGFCSLQQTHCIHCYRDCQCHLIAKVRQDDIDRIQAARASAFEAMDPLDPATFSTILLALRGEL